MSVCSSAPVGMKIQPLNQTALIVSWERPLTVYHPPITSYMVSYSWSKSDVADEKTFSKIGDQRTVGCRPLVFSHVFHFYGLSCGASDTSGTLGVPRWDQCAVGGDML